MTENEWLSSDDVMTMFNCLRYDDPEAFTLGVYGSRMISERKLRLWAVAALDVSDEDIQHVRGVHRTAHGMLIRLSWRGSNGDLDNVVLNEEQMQHAASILREVIGNPFHPITLPKEKCGYCDEAALFEHPHGPQPCPACGRDPGYVYPWLTPTVIGLAQAAYTECRPAQKCLRCKGAGHTKAPRPISNPTCSFCRGTGIIGDSNELDPQRLAVLSDALESEGCPSEISCLESMIWAEVNQRGHAHTLMSRWGTRSLEEAVQMEAASRYIPNPLLTHLRSPGPHVRGCWVLDLLLGHD